MAGGGFDDIGMGGLDKYRGYDDYQLESEYHELDARQDILTNDFQGVSMPDNARVEYAGIVDKLILIVSEQERRAAQSEGDQETSFTDEGGGRAVSPVRARRDRSDEYAFIPSARETEWIDEDINYRGTEGGNIRTLGTMDNIRLVVNKVLTQGGELREEGRKQRVKLLRSFLSVSETGGKVRPLLNSREGIELLSNVRYAKGGAAQLGGHVITLTFKGVDVAAVNSTRMRAEPVDEAVTQTVEYKEYRALVDKIFGGNTQTVEEVANSTETTPETVQSILNDSEVHYTEHTPEQIETMVRERSNAMMRVERNTLSRLGKGDHVAGSMINRLRRDLNNPKLFESAAGAGTTPLDASLLPEVPDHIIGEILDESVDRIHGRLHERARELENLALSEQQLREWSGILNPKGTADERTAALETTSIEYSLKAIREGDKRKETILRNIAATAELKIDLIYLAEEGVAPRHPGAKSILESVVEENESVQDLSRLERVKAWFKKNWLGASALGITVASLLTTIIIGLRSAVAKGAGAVGSFAKAVKDAISGLGPWAAPIANFLYTVLKGGAAVLSWLASNLWVLVIALTWFTYDSYKERRRTRHT